MLLATTSNSLDSVSESDLELLLFLLAEFFVLLTGSGIRRTLVTLLFLKFNYSNDFNQ